MRTLLVALFMFGLSHAAIQQQRSPVYHPSVTSTGASAPSGSTTPMAPPSPGLTTKTAPLVTPAPMLPTIQSPYQQVAQARESLASDASMIQSSATANHPAPSQNYYVYYYPDDGTGSNGQPNSSSIWSLGGWSPVATGVGCLALVLIGGGILYTRYGTEVKTRALRELKDMSAEDAARMARGVLRAIEKFSAVNNHAE